MQHACYRGIFALGVACLSGASVEDVVPLVQVSTGVQMKVLPNEHMVADDYAAVGAFSLDEARGWKRSTCQDNQTHALELPPADLPEDKYFEQLHGIIQEACGDLCAYKAPVGKGKFFDQILDVPQCEEVFSEGRNMLDSSSNRWPPPRNIPRAFLRDFTMGDENMKVGDWFFADTSEAHPLTWTKKRINNLVNTYNNQDFRTGTYSNHVTKAVHQVFFKFREEIAGKHCAVIGSQSPWVEALLLQVGVAKVTTIEYTAIHSQHPQIETMLPSEWYSFWKTENSRSMFDCIASYSSLEHAGLGRYRDMVNPWGDILAMQKVRCSLKKDGLVFLGVPTGPRDGLHWNAHRVYGPRRWPQMLAGLEQIDMQGDIIHPVGENHTVVVAKRI